MGGCERLGGGGCDREGGDEREMRGTCLPVGKTLLIYSPQLR